MLDGDKIQIALPLTILTTVGIIGVIIIGDGMVTTTGDGTATTIGATVILIRETSFMAVGATIITGALTGLMDMDTMQTQVILEETDFTTIIV